MGFFKGTLGKACEGVGIRCEHVPELGIASEQRQSLETQADYDALFAQYERESLPLQGSALAKIRDWVRSGERVALTLRRRGPVQPAVAVQVAGGTFGPGARAVIVWMGARPHLEDWRSGLSWRSSTR
jgi:uncharacterized protein (DUF488 family)